MAEALSVEACVVRLDSPYMVPLQVLSLPRFFAFRSCFVYDEFFVAPVLGFAEDIYDIT
jgi:hypothetical protein